LFLSSEGEAGIKGDFNWADEKKEEKSYKFGGEHQQFSLRTKLSVKSLRDIIVCP
jgi:hypothetical protein